MMDDLLFIKGFLILLAWAGLAALAYIKLKGYRKRRLVRCPELGIVTLVEAAQSPTETGPAAQDPSLGVSRCQLWPERENCGMGCLSRYKQTQGLFGFDLAALRPFDGHE